MKMKQTIKLVLRILRMDCLEMLIVSEAEMNWKWFNYTKDLDRLRSTDTLEYTQGDQRL